VGGAGGARGRATAPIVVARCAGWGKGAVGGDGARHRINPHLFLLLFLFLFFLVYFGGSGGGVSGVSEEEREGAEDDDAGEKGRSERTHCTL
jgi:hypothetical protein